MENKITYPCVYALSAGMGFGPISIPKEHRVSEMVAIEYVLGLMKQYIKGRAVIRWDEKGIKKATQFSRDEKGNPIYQK
jgi:hypothetical protein